MDIYVDTARNLLETIISGNIQYIDHLSQMKENIRKKLEQAERVVVCGMSPVGRIAMQELPRYTSKSIAAFDLRDELSKINCTDVYGGGTVYVICSREDAGRYLKLLPEDNTDIISYDELFLLDATFDYHRSAFHNQDYTCQRMEDVFLHAASYLDMMSDMSDSKSRNILARLILYRYSWDLQLCVNVKSSGKHYFKDMMPLTGNEVFVDCGGYNGDTLSDFLEVSQNNFLAYHYFEPEETSYKQVTQTYISDKRIFTYQKAVSNKCGTAFFDLAGEGDQGRTAASGTMEIKMARLDALALEPTFIKMDIEGAECEALDGAVETICKYMPKLAVCVYHRPNDLVDIYRRIRSYGYDTFYLRAEAESLDYEMVMYALADSGEE